MNIAAGLLAPVPQGPGSGIRLRLRQATEVLHRRVELQIGLLTRVWTAEAYLLLLQAMRGIHAPLERRLIAMDWSGTAIVMRERCKTPWLDLDLAHYGLDEKAIADLAECRASPPCENLPSGLGVLYVLEGSTLGAEVILRTLQLQLGISAAMGGRFFSGYGKMAGARWRSYLAELERVGESIPAAAAIEQAAQDTFAAFARWLAEAGLQQNG